MPTACLFVCVYLYTFIHIHTLYTYVSFVRIPAGFSSCPKPSFQDRTSTTAAGRVYTTQLYCTHLIVPRGTQSTFGIPHLASANDSSPVVFVDVVDPTLGEK